MIRAGSSGSARAILDEPKTTAAIHRLLAEYCDAAEMFDLAPVSLWLEDYSTVRLLFEEWRAAGITSLRDYLRDHPDRVKMCSDRIRVLKVNRRTLSLFKADDLPHLIGNLDRIFRDDMLTAHVDELAQL